MISHVAAILKIVMYPNVGFNITHTFGEVAGWEGLFHDICVGNSNSQPYRIAQMIIERFVSQKDHIPLCRRGQSA